MHMSELKRRLYASFYATSCFFLCYGLLCYGFRKEINVIVPSILHIFFIFVLQINVTKLVVQLLFAAQSIQATIRYVSIQ